ncbi:MAG: hypothetical protein II375_07760, partial [Bacteroidales bacterium]|nr:hypothetical protein [Bacteroidales bacterium]
MNRLFPAIPASTKITTSKDEVILDECPTLAELGNISILANGSYGCAGDQDTHIQTNTSHVNVTYTVYKEDASGNWVSTGYETVGNPGNQALRFFIKDEGTYRIKATCGSKEAWLNGEFEVRGYNPNTSIGTNNYCRNDIAGRILYIQNSEYNVKYSLYKDGKIYSNDAKYNPIGKADLGTDEIPLDNLPAGVYTVIAQRVGCSQTSQVSGKLVITNGATRKLTATSISGTGTGCAANAYKIGIDSYSAGVTYTLNRTDSKGVVTPLETYAPVSDGVGYQFSTIASDPGIYTITTSNPTCETVDGQQIVDNSTAPDVSLTYTNTQCDYTFTITGPTNPNYYYYLYVDDKTKPRASVQGNGGNVSFPTTHKTQSTTEVFRAFARPKDATDTSCDQDVTGAVTVPGVPAAPSPSQSIFYFCGTSGGNVTVKIGDNVTALCSLYTTGGKLVQQQSIKTNATDITFNNVPAGYYYVVAENNSGCISEKSSTITVEGKEFNPTLNTAIPKTFCMAKDGDT